MKQYLKELIKRKELLFYLVASGLKAEHRNSYLGYFWWLLDPFLNVGIYYFVVVFIFNSGGPDYGPYLVVGMIVWRWLSTTVNTASKSIIAQAGIISQIYLPKVIFAFSVTFIQMFNFGFGLIVIAIFILIFKLNPGLNLFWLPLVILNNLLFLLSIALIIAYISVFFRDFDNILNHLLRLWFFITPVIWRDDLFPERFRWVLFINPMTHILTDYRKIILYNNQPGLLSMASLSFFSIMLIIFSVYYYYKNEHKIIKYL